MLASWLSREPSSTSPIVSGSPRIDALASSGQKDLSGKRKGSKRKVVDVGGISPDAASALENSWSQGKRRVKKKRKKVTAKESKAKAKAKAVAPSKRSSATDMIPGTTLKVYPAGILASLPHDPYSLYLGQQPFKLDPWCCAAQRRGRCHIETGAHAKDRIGDGMQRSFGETW